MPQVSVIIPAYNAGPFLAQTLGSIRAQTLSDFECIVIDDGSQDNTLAVAQSYVAKDERFKLISRENRGVVATRNQGIELASAPWLAFLDADDLAHPQRLARQLAQLQAQDADVCSSWIRYIGHQQGLWQTPSTQETIFAYLLFDSALAQSSVMLNKAALGAHRYRQEAILAEDYALWCDLALAGLRFTGIDEALVDYRVHANQMSRQKRSQVMASAARVRHAYAERALPDPLQAQAQDFARCSDPAMSLTPVELDWYTGCLQKLAQCWPQSARIIAGAWVSALERSRRPARRHLPDLIRQSRQFALPANEQKRLYRQILRILLGDGVWQTLRQWRNPA